MANYKQQGGSKKKTIIIICIVAFVLIAILGNLIPKISETGGNTEGQGEVPSLTTVSGDEAGNINILPKTVMIYLDGADLEEKHKNSSRTIKEIIASGVDTERHNILLYTGGCDLWHDYAIPANKDCIYIIKNGKPQLLKEYPAQNVGAANTLKTFMQYCVTNYPAKQYGLILHNHGGGPNNGVCADFRNNCDMLNMNELQTAFKSVGFGPNAKMEFVFFDACLMASAEVAFSMKDYAHYMVASENVSYTYGSDYSFIRAIDLYNSGADIGRRYVDRFYNASMNLGYRISASGQNVYDITYSCIKLSEMEKLESAIDKLFQKASTTPVLERTLSTTSRLARGVMEYADSYGAATDTVYDLIDLNDWMTRSSYADKTLTDSIRLALSKAVIYNRASTPRMAGLTIYYPKNIRKEYTYNQFGFSDEYSEYVKRCYVAATASSSAKPWKNLDAQVKAITQGTSLSVNLTSKQAENFASAQYYILSKHSGLSHTFKKDEYILVSQGNNCTLSGKTLTAEFDYRVPVLYKKDGTSIPFCSPVFQKLNDQNEAVYSTYATLQYLPDLKDFKGERDPEGLNELKWQIENMRLDVAWLSMQQNGNALKILYGEKEGKNGLPSRTFINPNDYQEIQFMNPIRRAKYDKSGKLLPVSEWAVDTSLMLSTTTKVNETTLKLERLPDNVEYFGVMVLKDIYGNEYTTKILPLN